MSLPTKPQAAHLAPTNPCKISTCPLNEAGIHHDVGIYKQNGVSQTRGFYSVLFGSSNPPDFIWNASDERQEAMEKVRRGENVEVNKKVILEKEDLVGRFLDLHAGLGMDDMEGQSYS